MPFMGQDWRAPGETWVKTQEGWERMKLRPYRSPSDLSLEGRMERVLSEIPTAFADIDECTGATLIFDRKRTVSDSSTENFPSCSQPTFTIEDSDIEGDEEWTPHCFVKNVKSKEFVGCTSMSEAFHRLDLARAVTDVQRFNYVCKVVQILVREKLQNLSGSARKVLLSVVEAIVLNSVEKFTEVKTIRTLVGEFLTGLNGGQHCGSPQLLLSHQDVVSNLYHLVSTKQPGTPAESCEESVTFLDLPRECLREILRRLPEHQSLLEAAKAHEALESLVESEQRLWRELSGFHFTDFQMDVIRQKLQRDADFQWRHAFFELKKFYGLKESYADMIHICCYCRALFWKNLGHPCISRDPNTPSVRVTPQQFIDMLLFL